MNEDIPTLIKQQIKLSEIASQYTQLKIGSKYIGICPLPGHKEKTPSFQVDDQRCCFHCFGCNTKGDVFDLIQKMEGMDFRESLAYLAEHSGVILPKSQGPGTKLKIDLIAVNEAAVDYYQQQFFKNPEARAYLMEERGLKESTIRLFRIGATAPYQMDGLLTELRGKFPDGLLKQSGLFRKGKHRPYDAFRDRIIFPIRDVQGRTIGFGGRLLPSAVETRMNLPKYINSPETPIFKKARHLYNLDFAKPYLRKCPEAIIVEGYMDVLQCYQAGAQSVVAPLGTAFTQEQALLLRKFAEKVTLNFDGDSAGLKASVESIPRLLATDADVSVLKLPLGMDPDVFIKEHGIDTYCRALDDAPDFYPFLLKHHGGGAVPTNPRDRSRLADRILEVLAHIPQPYMREHYLGLLAQDLQVPTEVLRVQMTGCTQTGKGNPVGRSESHAQTIGNTWKGTAISSGRSEQPPSKQGKNPPVEPMPSMSKAKTQTTFKISSVRQEFLYHVMTRPGVFKQLSGPQRELLPLLVNHHFGGTLNDFVFADANISTASRIMLAPAAYRKKLRLIADADAPQGNACFCKVVQSLAKEMVLDRIHRNSCVHRSIQNVPSSTSQEKYACQI